MVGRLVRHKRDGTIGIVLRREITRKGNFRYHVFMDGGERAFLASILPCWLEVIA